MSDAVRDPKAPLGSKETRLVMALIEAYHGVMDIKDGCLHDEEKRIALHEATTGIAAAIRALGGNRPFRSDGEGRGFDPHNPEDVVLHRKRGFDREWEHTTHDGFKATRIHSGWLITGPGILTSLESRNLDDVKRTIAFVRRTGSDGRH